MNRRIPQNVFSNLIISMASTPIEEAIKRVNKINKENQIAANRHNAYEQERILKHFLRNIPNVSFRNDFTTCVAYVDGMKFYADANIGNICVVYMNLFNIFGLKWVKTRECYFRNDGTRMETFQLILERHLKALQWTRRRR